MKAILLLLFLFLSYHLPARQKPLPDSVSLLYAVPDTAARTVSELRYYVVKFNVYPGNVVRNYGVVMVIDPLHFILRFPDFDSSLRRKVEYVRTANYNWKASPGLLREVIASRDTITVLACIAGYPVHYSVLRVYYKDWDKFITQTNILFADRVRKASGDILINTYDPSANAVNTAQRKYPLINGDGITVSLKEDLMDTSDIDFEGRYIPSSFAATQVSSHATIMATMIGGAGNNGLKSLGAATRVKFSSADFNVSLAPEDPVYFKGISLQNHSYGTGIENYYGIEAAAYDEQVYATDTLLHVFSSGNIGTSVDSVSLYKGLSGYANLSGTFKQAKNVLVVGGTDDSLHVVSLSSRGPAYDGRVKPEIVAYGIDGTSGAAAVTSGVSALLQQAYKQQYGAVPSAALVKALLINSAYKKDDVPLSYAGGYGSLQALDALNTLQAKRFYKSVPEFTMQVPAGMGRLTVTLCWNDPAAALNAAAALVNDLDLSVSNSSGVYLPWVLSSAPSLDSLAAAPRRGRDSLNNVEQVTIDNPVAGDYKIHVHGSGAFYVVYDWVPLHSFAFLNPGSHEVLLSGGSLPLPLRWQSNIKGKGDLSYSLDSGVSWITLGQQLAAEKGLFNWSVPAVFSAALLRFSMADTTFVSDTFFLSPSLTLKTGYDCGDSAFLYWQSVAAASSYEVYRLGAQYLAPYTSAVDTFLFLSSPGSPYFAVSPVHKDGWTGLKSYGTNYTTQGTGCYFRSLLADLNGSAVLLTLNLGTAYNLQHLYWERLSANGYINLYDQAVSGVDYTYSDDSIPYGIIYYRVRLETVNGAVIYSDPVAVYHLDQAVVFPNPVQGSLHVLSKEIAGMQLQMYDLSGRLVLSRVFQRRLEDVWVGDLPAGVYIVVLYKDGKKLMTKKIVKN